MIVYEILGKVFDVLVAVEYYMIIGCLISVLRVSLNVWKIYLNCSKANETNGYEDNEDRQLLVVVVSGRRKEDNEKRYDDLSLVVSSLKAVLEAFPQSVIAKFYFVHCPIKKYGWGFPGCNL